MGLVELRALKVDVDWNIAFKDIKDTTHLLVDLMILKCPSEKDRKFYHKKKRM